MPSPRIHGLNLRASFLAALFTVAACLPLALTSEENRGFYFFDVTLTSTAAGLTRFSWDKGQGFNEYDSSAQPLKIEPRPVVYRYMVPPGAFRGFRLDPLDVPARITLCRAQLVDSRGKLIHAFKPTDLHSSQPSQLVLTGSTLAFTTVGELSADALDLSPGEPVVLPFSWWMELQAALPLATKVLLLGLALAHLPLARLRGVASRGVDWARPRPRSTLVAVAILAVAVQAHPVMFFGRSFVSPNNGSLMLYGHLPTLPGAKEAQYANTMGSDVGAMLFQHLYYPVAQHEALLGHHELPLWNRYSLVGTPLWGQGQSMIGDPFNLLTILANGASWAWDIRFLLAHGLLAAGLGLTSWSLTRHQLSAILVTVAGSFLGFFTFRINHPATFSLAYSPWILFAWVNLAQATTGRRQLAWLYLLLAANWIEFSSGTVKEAVALLVCLNLAGASIACLAPFTVGRRLRVLGLATVAGAVFVLLSAPLWLTFLTTLRHSVTAYDSPQVQTYSPLHAIGLFDDIFYRQDGAGQDVKAPSLNALVLFGFLAWLARPGAWVRHRAISALLLACLPPAALVFGFVPAAWIARVPFLGNIGHIGNTFSCPLLILLTLVAGAGFAELLRPAPAYHRYKHLGVVLLLGAVPVLVYFLSSQQIPKGPFFRGYLWSLALATAGLFLAAGWNAREARGNLLLVAVVLGLPLFLWRHAQALHTPFNQYVFTPGERVDLRAPSPAVASLGRQLGAAPARVIGLQQNLYPNFNTVLRWESLYGVDALRGGYYLELTGLLQVARVWNWSGGTPVETLPGLQRIHDLFNVGYYVGDHREPALPIPGLNLVTQLDLDVYSSPSAWPRAFFTDRVASYREIADFANLVAQGDGRPFAAIQEQPGHVTGSLPGGTLAGRAVVPATNYQLTANRTAFTIEATGPGVAVLTESYYLDDFEVTLDGTKTDYFRVNHAFKAVQINSAGRHEIAFRYRPSSLVFSLWLGGAGLLALGAGTAGMWGAARKKDSVRPGNPA